MLDYLSVYENSLGRAREYLLDDLFLYLEVFEVSDASI